MLASQLTHPSNRQLTGAKAQLGKDNAQLETIVALSSRLNGKADYYTDDNDVVAVVGIREGIVVIRMNERGYAHFAVPSGIDAFTLSQLIAAYAHSTTDFDLDDIVSWPAAPTFNEPGLMRFHGSHKSTDRAMTAEDYASLTYNAYYPATVER